MGWATAIQGAVGLYGASQGKKAAKAQGAAAQQGLDFSKARYADAQGNFQPYLQAGQQGLAGLNSLAGGDYSGFINSPDYQFRVQQANDGFESSAAARGRLFSGGAVADQMGLNQRMAGQGLGDYRQSLQYLAGVGQGAAGSLGGFGAQAANQIGQQYGQVGNAKAAGYGVNQQFAQGLGSSFGDWYGNQSANNYGGTGWYLGNNQGRG